MVSITPSVLTGGSADLETNGLLLTTSALIPTSTIALAFTDASSVSDYFGAESEEYDFAAQYFSDVTNAQKAYKTLIIARHISEAAAAWVQGGAITVSLSDCCATD